MDSVSIRQKFFDFFSSKDHAIVPSSSMVVKDDPTLMFTNAGMNQFKDIFLGNSLAKYKRVADTQKCLRVSGKHNDLEEVGHDTYHHTMFEMLGNWSFGDYFKKEAITWAWEFLVEVMKIDKASLYVTVFEGSEEEGLDMDKEAYDCWKEFIDENRIVTGSKKDNFWEMGDVGPCGPCSEIHIDLRTDEEKKQTPGKQLVNGDHPEVIEIWNLVFIQFNRKADGSLETLPDKHVDTGMGFERLCMVIQQKKSNYDTDIFQNIIAHIEKQSGIPYGKSHETDIAMRVVADHLRAVAFAIADGQLPSNNKAGYVIRRILRRAVRYFYTFLGFNEPVMYTLFPVLESNMGKAFPELTRQREIIIKVIKEEETSFLRTLETGIKLLENLISRAKKNKTSMIKGSDAFELYDTYGFPLDLTQLICREHYIEVDTKGFDHSMQKQKERSKKDATVETGDWIKVDDGKEKIEFVGYDSNISEVKIKQYRISNVKGKKLAQLIFTPTPFYAESGGQVGDKGWIKNKNETIEIVDTIKENNLIIHLAKKLPENLSETFTAIVDSAERINTENNHTATHLLHHALREVLGNHVEQKGSFVHPKYLRFDFSHFQKMSDEEMERVEKLVNTKIRENSPRDEFREIPMKKAKDMGAMALFGEKYGEDVRVIKFGDSVELCGGTHVASTGQIGYFIITSESAVSAGIRRIEAITGEEAEKYIRFNLQVVKRIGQLLKATKNIEKSVEKIILENQELNKKLNELKKESLKSIKKELLGKIKKNDEIQIITEKLTVDTVDSLRDLSFQLKDQLDNLFLVLGAEINGKAHLSVMISEKLVEERNLNAGHIIREISKEIQGGGGGQPFFATAGGKNPKGIKNALEKALRYIKK